MRGVLTLLLLMVISFHLCAQNHKVDDLQQQILQCTDDTAKISLYLKLSESFLDSDPSKSKQAVKKAYELSDSLHSEIGMARSLYYWGTLLVSEKKYEEAIVKLDAAIPLFEQEEGNIKLAKVYSKKGYALRNEKKYDFSIENYLKSLDLLQKENNKKLIATTLYSLGITLKKNGLDSEALERYYESLELFKEMGDRDGESMVLNSIGLLQYKLRMYQSAQESFEKVLEIEEQTNDLKGKAMVLNNLGLVHDRLKEYDKTIHYYKESIQIKKELSQKPNLCVSYLNLGLIYVKTDSFENALKYLEKALELSLKYNNYRVQAKSYGYIGACFTEMEQYNQALPSLEKGLEISTQAKEADIAKWTSGMISQCYEKMNKYQQALDYYKLYIHLTDSLNERKRKIEIADIVSKHELKQHEEKLSQQKRELLNSRIINLAVGFGAFLFLLLAFLLYYGRKRVKKANLILAQKNAEIEAQKLEIEKRNQLLEQQKIELEETNQSKDKLFSIIGHDLRNPIGLLDSVLDTIFDSNFQLDKEDIDSLLKSIHGSAKSALSLLENLLYWANSQRGALKIFPRICNLKELVDEAIRIHAQLSTNKNISIRVFVEKAETVWCDIDMLRLVIRNLLSNAIKFSYQGGTIEFTSNSFSDHVQVSVTDYGVGIEEENIQSIFKLNGSFSTPGTSREHGSGIGLTLCEEFVTKNKGEIWVESVSNSVIKPEEKSGSTFHFTLPKPP